MQRSKPLQRVAVKSIRMSERTAQIFWRGCGGSSLLVQPDQLSRTLNVGAFPQPHCYGQAKVLQFKLLAAFILLLLATLLFFSRSDSVLLNRVFFFKEKVVLWSPSKRVTLPNFLFVLELQHHVSTGSCR